MIDAEIILRRLREVVSRKRAQTAKQLEAEQTEDDSHRRRVTLRVYDALTMEVDEMLDKIKEDETP